MDNTGPNSSLPTTDESAIRRSKIETLRNNNIEPWPQARPTDGTCADLLAEFDEHVQSQPERRIAGRVITMRGHGKAVFAHIQDSSGKLQLYVKQDVVGIELFSLWNSVIDIGDIVWCLGSLFKTKTGEITLSVKEFVLLSKCLHPLPDKFHGIADVEMKYRKSATFL
jgi:lysyl-tRNA synthetase class 2